MVKLFAFGSHQLFQRCIGSTFQHERFDCRGQLIFTWLDNASRMPCLLNLVIYDLLTDLGQLLTQVVGNPPETKGMWKSDFLGKISEDI